MEGPWPDISKDAGRPYAMLGVKPDLFTCNGTSLSMGPHEYKMNLADHRQFNSIVFGCPEQRFDVGGAYGQVMGLLCCAGIPRRSKQLLDFWAL